MKDFKGLKVWEKAYVLTLAIYDATKAFPREKLYGLTSQLRRSMASVPTNLVEGSGRSSAGDRGRFFDIAFGSASEAQYQLILARDLGYLPATKYEELNIMLEEIKRMLAGLLKNLRFET